MKKHSPSRRAFVKKAAYVAPAVLSLQAFSSMAKAGSHKGDRPDKDDKKPKLPKKQG